MTVTVIMIVEADNVSETDDHLPHIITCLFHPVHVFSENCSEYS